MWYICGSKTTPVVGVGGSVDKSDTLVSICISFGNSGCAAKFFLHILTTGNISNLFGWFMNFKMYFMHFRVYFRCLFGVFAAPGPLRQRQNFFASGSATKR